MFTVNLTQTKPTFGVFIAAYLTFPDASRVDRKTLASKDDEALMSNIRTPSMNETLIFVFYIYSKTNLFHIVWN